MKIPQDIKGDIKQNFPYITKLGGRKKGEAILNQIIIDCVVFLQVYTNVSNAQSLENPLKGHNSQASEGLMYTPCLWDNKSSYTLPSIEKSSRLREARNFYNETPNKEKPALKFGKMAAQFGIGIIGGWVANISATPWFENTKVKGDAGYNPNRHNLMFVSSIIGTSLGVYLIGNIGESESSYLSTALGVTIGSLPLLIPLLSEDPYYFFHAFTYGVVLQTIGGIIGFNLSRRYDSVSSSMGLINIRNNGVFFVIPALASIIEPKMTDDRIGYQIHLLQITR